MKVTIKSEEEIPSNVLFPGDVITFDNPDKFFLVLDSTYFPKEDLDKIFLFNLQTNFVTWISLTDKYNKVKLGKYTKVKSEIVISFNKERT